MRSPHKRIARAKTEPGGFTLLEVILAIAVLGLSLVTINNVVRLSYENTRRAADDLEARLVAESIMGELLCGGRDLVAAGATPMTTTDGSSPRYVFEIQVDQTTSPSLMLLRVIVTDYEDADQTSPRALCTLERWKIDPNYLSQVAAANAEQ